MKKRRVWILVGAIALALAVALPVFQPWKLFVDVRVDEAFPVVAAGGTTVTTAASTTTAPPIAPTPTPTATAGVSSTTTSTPMTTAVPTTTTATPPAERRGTFSSRNHPTAGTARLVTLADGSVVVRLEDFETDNGPDVVVYLSPAAGDASNDALGADPVFLGELKGNVGNQNYVVPPGTDLGKARSVVIWCRRFSVPFGVAGLAPV